MAEEFLVSNDWLVSISILILGLFIGLLFELIVFRRIRRISKTEQWKVAKIIFKSLRGLGFIWFFLFSCYFSLLNSPLDENLITTMSDIILLLLSISVVFFLARITSNLITSYTSKTEGALTATSIVTNLTNSLFFILAFLIIIESLGLDITPLITILGIGGLTVALALQPTLSNFFAGLYLLFSREFKIGDYVKLDSGDEGYITDMNWRHTIIRPPSRYDIVIPNARLSSAIVNNYTITNTNISVLSFPLGVGYDSDLNHVEKVTIEVAEQVIKAIQGELPEKKPYVRYHTFAPFSIDLNVIIYIKNLRDRAKIRHEFMKELFERYKKEHIDIPYPTSVIYSKTR